MIKSRSKSSLKQCPSATSLDSSQGNSECSVNYSNTNNRSDSEPDLSFQQEQPQIPFKPREDQQLSLKLAILENSLRQEQRLADNSQQQPEKESQRAADTRNGKRGVKVEEKREEEDMEDDSDEPKQGGKRGENSLAVLTKKFVEIIRESANQVVDLNTAVATLGVQKRRIYDITNVLEGIGVVEKVFKNQIRWIGSFEEDQGPECEGKLIKQKYKLISLMQYEQALNKLTQLAKQNLESQLIYPGFGQQETYVQSDDLQSISQILQKEGDIVLVLYKMSEDKFNDESVIQKQLGPIKQTTICNMNDKRNIEMWVFAKGEPGLQLGSKYDYASK